MGNASSGDSGSISVTSGYGFTDAGEGGSMLMSAGLS